MRNRQSGVMLLEAMIAILIFSLGVLGVVGMQAMAVRASRDAQYRSEASLLVNDLVGQMWVADRTGAELVAKFQGNSVPAGAPATPYDIWCARVVATLPGASDFPPVVTVVPGEMGPPRASSKVDIAVRWKAPNETTEHRYQVSLQII